MITILQDKRSFKVSKHKPATLVDKDFASNQIKTGKDSIDIKSILPLAHQAVFVLVLQSQKHLFRLILKSNISRHIAL